ncbi:MAG TPA: glycosyltransferase [Tahibacter sp.]|uniref:glycosyltransferase n=1 Tax=Tahibacter sp. TaxID=2056211 RepID=UPI002BADDEDF|nr:glycosyltransferase [Tahibacter sp.]HSX59916.1 glycosyltransferase [Tahibacter sp.]
MIFFTIVSRNYLAYALTLMQSLAAQHPQSRRYVVLADRDEGDPDLANPLFDLVRIEELDLPDFDAFTFRYDILELNTAIKPYAFRRLRARHPGEAVVYLDPDTYVLAPLTAVAALVDDGALAVLTPHLNAPTTDERHPGELAILRSGTYNLGFCAIGTHAGAARLVDWWAEKLEQGCVADPAAGLFTDQKWMDLAPGLFPDVRILRDDGYNLAYWNLAQRRVAREGERWTANDGPLVFVHFSGIDVDRPQAFSRHQDRYRRSDIGALEPLYAHYLECLQANGHARHRDKPYAFGRFADGEAVTRPLRAVYRRYFDKGCAEPELHPWQMARDRYDLPCDEIAHRADAPVTRLMYAAWRLRADLHAAFDLTEREGREGFIRWFLRTAQREFGIAPRHIEPVRAAFGGGHGAAPHWDATGRVRVAGAWPRLSAASLALIDWSCRQRWALALYGRVPARWRHRLRRGLERAAFVPSAPEAASVAPPLAAPVAHDGLNLVGYARGEFGVAEVLRNFADALRRGGIPFGVRNVEIGVASRQNDRRLDASFDDTLPQEVSLFCINADQMPVVHEHLGASAFAGRHNIGCWFWELERFPPRWHGALDLVDEVWVLSDFVRAAIAACTDKPVRVMPFAVEPPPLAPLSRRALDLPDDAFVVLASFDFNSWITRKNPQAAIAAFRAAFPPQRRDVRLLLKTINGHRLPGALRALHDAAAGDERIEVRDGFLDRDGMWALQAGCDVYLSLHRSEGFGLGLAECMALGKPVVATAYSGNLQFMREDNSALVPYRLVPVAEGEYPDWRGQHWAEPDIDAAAAHLRRFADDPALARRVGTAARDTLRRDFGADAAAAAIRQRLDQIRGAALR